MRRSNKMQLISDRPPRRLISAGPADPEGMSDDANNEGRLVEFLKFYTRLHTDDICTQSVDPSNMVAWVFVDGVWQVRRGIEPQLDNSSWCQVYLTAALGLDPLQYKRAKRELFTSKDGLTGVYRHKTRPAHALVYRPSRGLSTASIAAITAGSSAAVAGLGSMAWYLKNKKAKEEAGKTPLPTLGSGNSNHSSEHDDVTQPLIRTSEVPDKTAEAISAALARVTDSETSKDLVTDPNPDVKLPTEDDPAVLKLATDYVKTVGKGVGQCAVNVGLFGAATAGQCVRKGADILQKYAEGLGYTGVADAGKCAATCVAKAGFTGMKKLGRYTADAGYGALLAFWNYVVKNTGSGKEPLLQELNILLERAKQTGGESDNNEALENIQFAVRIYQLIAEKLERGELPLAELKDLLKLREEFGTESFDPFDHALNQIYETFKDHKMHDQLMRVLIEHDASENKALLESIQSRSLAIDYNGGLDRWVKDLQDLLGMVNNLEDDPSKNNVLGSEYSKSELTRQITQLIEQVGALYNKP